LKFACLLLAACSVAAWSARAHWVAELFSHFVAHYAAAGVVLAAALLVMRRPAWALLPGALAAGHAAMLISSTREAPEPAATEAFEVIQFNVGRNHADPARVADWLRRQAADVVVLLEVGPAWQPTLEKLHDRYPHQASHLLDSPFGLAVLSRIAPDDIAVHSGPTTPHPYGEITLRLPRTGASLRVIGVHPPPPISRELARVRDAHLLDLATRAAGDRQRTTVVAGDFNTTPWSPLYRDLLAAGLRDGRPAVRPANTWPALPGAALWGIAIDHTLVTPGARIVQREVGPDLGSDHLPVRTRVAIGGGQAAR